MLPNWIIAGAPKTATSSLFRWLVDHPEAAGSEEKETYYFVDPGTHMFRPESNFAAHGLAGYEKLFARCPPTAKVVVESTPGYMYSRTALRELPALPTQPNFLFVLREPIAQLRSLFVYFQQNWNWIDRDMSFAEFIAAAEGGNCRFKGNELAIHALHNAGYCDHLHRWQDAVGARRMHILLFEDVVGAPRQVMRRLARRASIAPGFYDDYHFPAENMTYHARFGRLQDFNIWARSRIPKGRAYDMLRRIYRTANTRAVVAKPADQATVERLTRFYEPGLVRLERDFGLDLTSWRTARLSGISEQVGPIGERSPGASSPREGLVTE